MMDKVSGDLLALFSDLPNTYTAGPLKTRVLKIFEAAKSQGGGAGGGTAFVTELERLCTKESAPDMAKLACRSSAPPRPGVGRVFVAGRQGEEEEAEEGLGRRGERRGVRRCGAQDHEGPDDGAQPVRGQQAARGGAEGAA